MTVGQRLHFLRKQKRLTHLELARLLGVDRSTSIKWETGGSKPTRYLQQLADFYGVTVDYILNGNEKETAPPSTDLIDFIKYGNYTIDGKPVRAAERERLFWTIQGFIAALPLSSPEE